MKLASIFTDHMVVQANKPIKVFGEGKGKVRVEFLGKAIEHESDGGKWCVALPEESYGGPYEMKISLDGEEVILKDIYVGEVWLACGQSNMEMPLFRTEYGLEEAKHSDNDMLRLFTVPRRTKKDVRLHGWHFEKTTGEDTPWKLCNEESSLHFTAVGYYAAKELQEKLGVAVGVISCNWGGVAIETFISRDYYNRAESLKPALKSYNEMVEKLDMAEYEEKYKEGLKKWEEFYNAIDYDEVEEVRQKGVRATAGMPFIPVPWLPHGPNAFYVEGVIYDAMVSRIAPFGVKGMIWYQGESNNSENYLEKYLTFMDCMRDTFENKDMAFYAIELASFSSYWSEEPQQTDDRFVSGNNWAFTREQQQKATEIAENNYLVTSMELGDLYDIHPIHKKFLSQRMSRKILQHSYGFDINADQPIFDSVEFKDSKAYVSFRNAKGLYCKNPVGIKIYLADERKELKRAKVEIKDDGLILSSDEVKNPTIVRYGFDYYYSGCHMYNEAGLPVAPFRTDK
mgnify:FL=1